MTRMQDIWQEPAGEIQLESFGLTIIVTALWLVGLAGIVLLGYAAWLMLKVIL